MKTLGRILIILIAAITVIGVTYALSQTTAFSTLVGQPIGESETGDRPAPTDFISAQSTLTEEASEHPTGGPESRGGSWETVGRNLLEIAALVAVVQVLWSIGGWLKRAAASLTWKDRSSPGRSS